MCPSYSVVILEPEKIPLKMPPSRFKRKYKDMQLRPTRRPTNTQQWNTSRPVDAGWVACGRSDAIPGVAHLDFEVEEAEKIWKLVEGDNSARAAEGKVLLLLICHMMFPHLFW